VNEIKEKFIKLCCKHHSLEDALINIKKAFEKDLLPLNEFLK
jgi:hypothetical protein